MFEERLIREMQNGDTAAAEMVKIALRQERWDMIIMVGQIMSNAMSFDFDLLTAKQKLAFGVTGVSGKAPRLASGMRANNVAHN